MYNVPVDLQEEFRVRTKPFVVCVCGGRDFLDTKLLSRILGSLKRPTLLVHGGARGADALADAWARKHDIPVIVFAADWRKHKKAAGPIRNGRMLAEANPRLVIAFPGGSGTADCAGQARARDILVMYVGG